jgi:hypothetical protein
VVCLRWNWNWNWNWDEESGVDRGVETYRLICLLFGVGGVPFL